MYKKILLISILTMVLFLSRAWDAVEIEARGYVLGVAIDEYPPMPEGQAGTAGNADVKEDNSKLGTMDIDLNAPKYSMTVQFPIIRKASASMAGTSGGGGGGQGLKTWQITQMGISFSNMNEEITARTNLIPYYEHLQVIIISEAVARKGLENVLDFFIRDPEMRRRVYVFISKGEAKRILDVVPKVEDYSSIYLSKLPLSAKVNSRIIYQEDLGEMLTCLHSGEDFVLPAVLAEANEIKDDGCAVFSGDKLVAFGSKADTEAIKILKNKTLGGIYTAPSPVKENAVISIKIAKVRTKITPVPVGDGYRFDFDVKIDGNIEEFTNQYVHGKINDELISQVEESISRQEEKRCRETIKRMQEEYKSDAFNLDRIVKAKLPDYWDKVRDQWHTVFPSVRTNVHVSAEIRQIGNVR